MLYSVCHPVIQLVMIAGFSFCAFFLTGFFCYSLWHTLQEGIRYLRRLHQVPCDRCRYFTGEHLLKCTVHPCKAFSESALNCLDFAPGIQTFAPSGCQKEEAHPSSVFPLPSDFVEVKAALKLSQ